MSTGAISPSPIAQLQVQDETKAEIIEGSASMLYDKSEAVFYNKVQVMNRDLSIQVISHFARTRSQERSAARNKKLATAKDCGKLPFHESFLDDSIHILDALAATGLRSVRYLKEIPLVRHVTVNDLDASAVAAARENVSRNGVDPSRVTLHHGDASLFMYSCREYDKRFDVIDLDPYGSAVPFLDAAVQAVADGGLLCVTCTDAAVLCGTYPEKCFALYGSIPLRHPYLHEMSLRILLHAIDNMANKYRRHIVPWLCVSVDFYVRVFVRVFESAAEVSLFLAKI